MTDWARVYDDGNEHVIIVAFDVRAPNRASAQDCVMGVLPGEARRDENEIDSWWVCEDDRIDGSDQDSCVFVRPGMQAAATSVLRALGLAN